MTEAIRKLKVPALECTCLRCGYVHIRPGTPPSTYPEPPKRCPSCKNAYWNHERGELPMGRPVKPENKDVQVKVEPREGVEPSCARLGGEGASAAHAGPRCPTCGLDLPWLSRDADGA